MCFAVYVTVFLILAVTCTVSVLSFAGMGSSMELHRDGSKVTGNMLQRTGKGRAVTGTWRNGYVDLSFAGEWPKEFRQGGTGIGQCVPDRFDWRRFGQGADARGRTFRWRMGSEAEGVGWTSRQSG